MDMGKPVKYDPEIMVIGLGNILSGCSGGFTGSYIFSQTIFTYRTHTNTRMVGLWVIAGELLLFVLRVDPMMYIPLVSTEYIIIRLPISVYDKAPILVHTCTDFVF